MNKLFLLSATILMMATDALAQHECTIEGHVKGLEKGTVMMLFRSDGRVGTRIASDTVQCDERFHFKVKVENGKLDLYNLMANNEDFPSMALNIYAVPDAKIKISGNDKLIYTWNVKSNVKQQIELNKFTDCAYEDYVELQKLRIKMMKQHMKKETAKETREMVDKVQMRIDKKIISYMENSKVTDIWIDNLKSLSKKYFYFRQEYPYRKDLLALYDRLSPEQKLSENGKNIKVSLYPPKVVKNGENIIDADLFDLDGKKHHLSDLKGKYILMDFWSSGCGPCIMAMPEMKEISETYKDKVEVVSLSIDKKDTWKAACARHDITWNNWNEMNGEAGLYANYGVKGIPHYLLISPEGKLVSSWMGYGKESLKTKLRKLIFDEPSKISQKSKSDNISIMDVRPKDDATEVLLRVYNTPHYWVKMSSDTHLKLKDGTILKIKSADGIKLDEEHFFGDENMEEYMLHFDKLPEGCKQFDFIESGSWVIENVIIN